MGLNANLVDVTLPQWLINLGRARNAEQLLAEERMSWVCCCGCLLDNRDLNVLGNLHVTVCGGVDDNVPSNSVFYWGSISPDGFPLSH